jgi:hypothetical protein
MSTVKKLVVDIGIVGVCLALIISPDPIPVIDELVEAIAILGSLIHAIKTAYEGLTGLVKGDSSKSHHD